MTSPALPQATTPLVGTVKFRAGNPKPSNYPPHEPTCNIVVTLPDGTDGKIWGPPEFLGRFQKGQQLPLVRSPKGALKIDIHRLPKPAPDPQPPATTAPKPPAIASEIAALTALWASCYSSAKRSLAGTGAPAEAIQAAASSAYIQMTRTHGIDALVVANGEAAKPDLGW